MIHFGDIVVIRRSGDDSSRFPWRTRKCVFGASETSDIRVRVPTVSPDHCMLEVQPNNRVTATNYSKNQPTQINGKPLISSCFLANNATISIGDRQFRFEYPEDSIWNTGTESSENSTEMQLEFSKSLKKKSPSFQKTPRPVVKSIHRLVASETSKKIPLSPKQPLDLLSNNLPLIQPTSGRKTVRTPIRRTTPIGKHITSAILGTSERYKPTPPRPVSQSPLVRVEKHPGQQSPRKGGFQRRSSSAPVTGATPLKKLAPVHPDTPRPKVPRLSVTATGRKSFTSPVPKTPPKANISIQKKTSNSSPKVPSRKSASHKIPRKSLSVKPLQITPYSKKSSPSPKVPSMESASPKTPRKSLSVKPLQITPNSKKSSPSPKVPSMESASPKTPRKSLSVKPLQITPNSKKSSPSSLKVPSMKSASPKTPRKSLSVKPLQITPNSKNSTPASRKSRSVSPKSRRSNSAPSPKQRRSSSTPASPVGPLVSRKRHIDRGVYSQPPSKRKRVSFGPNLSPEHFDKSLPPATPLRKGASPRYGKARLVQSLNKRKSGPVHKTTTQSAKKVIAASKVRLSMSSNQSHVTPLKKLKFPSPKKSGTPRPRISGVISLPPTPDSNLMDSNISSRSVSLPNSPRSPKAKSKLTPVKLTPNSTKRVNISFFKRSPVMPIFSDHNKSMKEKSPMKLLNEKVRRKSTSSIPTSTVRTPTISSKQKIKSPVMRSVERSESVYKSKSSTSQSKTRSRSLSPNLNSKKTSANSSRKSASNLQNYKRSRSVTPTFIKNFQYRSPKTPSDNTKLTTTPKSPATPNSKKTPKSLSVRRRSSNSFEQVSLSAKKPQKSAVPKRRSRSLTPVKQIASTSPKRKPSLSPASPVKNTLAADRQTPKNKMKSTIASQILKRSYASAVKSKKRKSVIAPASSKKTWAAVVMRKNVPIKAVTPVPVNIKLIPNRQIERLVPSKFMPKTPRERYGAASTTGHAQSPATIILKKARRSHSKKIDNSSDISVSSSRIFSELPDSPMYTPRMLLSPSPQSSRKSSGVKAKSVSKTPSFLGLRNMLKTPKQAKTPSYLGIKELVRSPKQTKTPSLKGVKELIRTPKQPKTPSYLGIKELVRSPKQTKTPSFKGVKELVRTPKEAKTPSYLGIKELVRTPKEAKTPSYLGIKELVKTPKQPKSPSFFGIREMMNTPEQAKSPFVEILHRLSNHADNISFEDILKIFQSPSSNVSKKKTSKKQTKSKIKSNRSSQISPKSIIVKRSPLKSPFIKSNSTIKSLPMSRKTLTPTRVPSSAKKSPEQKRTTRTRKRLPSIKKMSISPVRKNLPVSRVIVKRAAAIKGHKKSPVKSTTHKKQTRGRKRSKSPVLKATPVRQPSPVKKSPAKRAAPKRQARGRKRSPSPIEQAASPVRKSPSPVRQPSPIKKSPAKRAAPKRQARGRKRSPSPIEKAAFPVQKSPSPVRKPSPVKKSPAKRAAPKRQARGRKRSPSPIKKAASPVRKSPVRQPSPVKKSPAKRVAPKRQARGRKRSPSPIEQAASPVRKSPVRQPSPVKKSPAKRAAPKRQARGRKRSPSPIEQAASPVRKSPSLVRQPSPVKKSPAKRAAPKRQARGRKRSPSPIEKAASPVQKTPSPVRKPSPVKKSPAKRAAPKRQARGRKRSPSPIEKAASPVRKSPVRQPSPIKKSPAKRAASKRPASGRKRSLSPVQKAVRKSPAPKRQTRNHKKGTDDDFEVEVSLSLSPKVNRKRPATTLASMSKAPKIAKSKAPTVQNIKGTSPKKTRSTRKRN